MKIIFCVLVFGFGIPLLVYGQCYPDRHNTNWYDGWVSCEAYPNPNSAHGVSHWILYDFGQIYRLNDVHIWNYNEPDYLGQGLKDVLIDYSMDGSNWANAGTFTFEQATGLSTYEGSQGPDLGGINAQFVLITALDNWGGDACYGLSEVRFAAEEVASTATDDLASASSCLSMQIYPNPFSSDGRVMIQAACAGRIKYKITDVLGRLVDQGELPGRIGIHDLDLEGRSFPSGSYLVCVSQGNQRIRQQMLKID